MKNILCTLLLAVAVWPVWGQIRGNELTVLVTPDHDDWHYNVGEVATFTVRILRAEVAVKDALVSYELGPEMYPTEKASDVALTGGALTLQSTMDKPGFLRCKVTTTIDGHTYEGCATAAYAPENLLPMSGTPEDFKSYWEGTLAYARQTPLDTTMRLLPERCTALDNVYEISFNTLPWGGRLYAILSIPKAEGTYPALLRVPGAGVRPYNGDTYTASGKIITLEIGIHGVPVTMQQQVYDDLMAGALNCYWTFGNTDRDKSYYHRVVIGALRAVDVICCLPQYNGKALVVTGSSQGGALSIITAALDKRITALAAVHPALSDLEASYSGRACGWPHYYYNNGEHREAERLAMRYYDVANFAKLLTQPGWYSWGYNDDVCPPTTTYAIYNTITAPKELHPYQQTAHFWYQEQWDVWQDWLRKQLGVSNE